MASKHLKIFFHAMDGTGHLNACVGLAQALARRGHEITFLLNAGFAGQFRKFGFEEILLKTREQELKQQEAKEEALENPIKEMAKMLLESGVMNGKSSFEKLEAGAKGEEEFCAQQYEVAADFNPQIEQAIKQHTPDLIILDILLIPPAVLKVSRQIPWIFLSSGNPLVMLDNEKLPPPFSGYATDGDQSRWAEFRQMEQVKMFSYYRKAQEKLWDTFHCTAEQIAESIIPTKGLFPLSKLLNIYGYPQELDYHDKVTFPDNFHRVDAFCRDLPETFQLPESFTRRTANQKLIFFSLGSMGSVDVELMKRIVSMLAKTEHKVIVSKGQLGDEYELPDNCWGENFLPQTRILPFVDLVITHGGNNTVTETFTFGKPLIVLPLFADQYDNAQRIQEKGFGLRFEPYSMQEDAFLEAIHSLLNDQQLKKRVQKVANRIEQSQSKVKACERIEQVLEEFRSKQDNE